MEIGLVGLGKMGFNLAQNIYNHKHQIKAFDLNASLIEGIGKKGIQTVSSLEALTKTFTGKKVIWLMIPAGNAVDKTIEALKPLLAPGDIIIDGGNSNFKESMPRPAKKFPTIASSKVMNLNLGTLS